jgi:carboxyl-terminal processing protease
MKKKLPIILTPVLFALILILGIYMGKSMNQGSKEHFTVYPKVDKLHAVMNYIVQDYVDTVSQEDFVEAAIPKILEQLDPHSMYIPARDMEAVNEPIEGNFDGIGVMFNIQNDTIMVINTINGGPSEKLGVLAGDRIVYVDDSLVAGVKITNSQVMKALKGKSGTEVTIKVKRSGFEELIPFTIKRDKIPIKSVDVAFEIAPKTAYIKISKFGMKTYKEFQAAVLKHKRLGCNSWVIDLRGNGGGVMQTAVQIADEFLERGNLIVYTEGKARPREDIVATNNGVCKNDNVVVLIDEWSASASEIVAGALQDNDRCTIVGRRSFGKGLVQEPTFFPDGSGLRLTIARYYTPTGRCIQKSYGDDLQDYYMDIAKRYSHGEFTERDSIHFADSLKYETPKGKIVYGGGGIMPDYFVSVDTTGYSESFRKIVAKGLIYKFAFKYSDKNRNELLKYKDHNSLNKYLKSEKIYNQLIAFVKKEGVELKSNELRISKQRIENFVLAYINRNILDDEGFYPTILKDDITAKKALEVLVNQQ